MDIQIRTLIEDEFSTIGCLSIDGIGFCFTLEDEYREVKVKGETRIPRGIYKLGIRKELSGLTRKYRDKYDWFENHIQILDVPDFNYVYIHVGNYETHTDGCILLGNSATKRNSKADMIGNSVDAFKEFYLKIYPLLKCGEDINLTVI